MLNKNDLKSIEGIVERTVERIVDKRIKDNLSEFFQHILAPYLDQEHKEIMQNFKENDEDHENIFRKLDRNQDEHDEMLQKLGEIENHVEHHDKRIKKLEALTIS